MSDNSAGGWDWRSQSDGRREDARSDAPATPDWGPKWGLPSPDHEGIGGQSGPGVRAEPESRSVDDRDAALAQIWREARVDTPTPRRLRSAGPRFTGGGIALAGGMLLLLVTIGIVGVLGSRVLASLDEGVVGGSTPARVDSPTQDAACSAGRRTLATALAAYEATRGVRATSQDELVAAGLLDAPVEGFAVDPTSPEAVRAIEPCVPS